MYLDDMQTPVYDGSADDFLRRPFNIFAQQVGVDPTTFDDSFNQQNATYCPMPFTRRCRIEWIGNLQQVHFYEVQARLFESDANVHRFSPDDLSANEKEIQRIAEVLREPNHALGQSWSDPDAIHIDENIAPNETRDVLKLEDGPSRITHFSVRAFETGPAGERVSEAVLRQTVMRVYFDGHAQPQIECPVGDFFGAGPGVNPFDALPFHVDMRGFMSSRFIMPYASSVRIELTNMCDRDVHFNAMLLRAPAPWDHERSMHLYARWRVDHDLIGDPQSPQDIPFVVADGQGRYVGTASIMLNPTEVPTPAGGWWGEGDEKIFVDGDVRPGTYGTGSEDYYDYAWSIPDIFGFAYCGQPRNDGPGNRGFVTNHRWHIIDDLPFNDRIAFYMELWPHGRVPGFSYGRLSYFYARPGLIDDHLPITPDDVRHLELAPDWEPRAWWGAQNSTFIEPETAIASEAATSQFDLVEGHLYSRGRLFQWRPRVADEEIAFEIPIHEDGAYAVDLCALKSTLSGTVRFWVDDHADQATDADLASPGRRVLRRVRSQPLELTAGKHTLHVQFRGAPNEIIGIDFIWLQKR